MSGATGRLAPLEAAQARKAMQRTLGMTEAERDLRWAQLKRSLEDRTGRPAADPSLSPEEAAAELGAFKAEARAYVEAARRPGET